jgi:hypothetical protein
MVTLLSKPVTLLFMNIYNSHCEDRYYEWTAFITHVVGGSFKQISLFFAEVVVSESTCSASNLWDSSLNPRSSPCICRVLYLLFIALFFLFSCLRIYFDVFQMLIQNWKYINSHKYLTNATCKHRKSFWNLSCSVHFALVDFEDWYLFRFKNGLDLVKLLIVYRYEWGGLNGYYAMSFFFKVHKGGLKQ